MTTRWRCKFCGLQDIFQHPASLVGRELTEEVRVQHKLKSPRCEFWETKVIIKRLI